MSELKWNWAYFPYLDPPEKQKESAQTAGYIKVVSKDEADKVIEKLEEKHLRDLQDAEDSFKSVLELNRKELRHHKYKRCLDKAKWCKLWYEEEKNEWQLKDVRHWFRMSLFGKWHKRWLELAEKFK